MPGQGGEAVGTLGQRLVAAAAEVIDRVIAAPENAVILGLAQVMKLIAAVGDAVAPDPANGAQLLVVQRLGCQGIVIDRNDLGFQRPQQGRRDVGGERDLGRPDRAQAGFQHLMSAVFAQTTDRRMLEQLHPLRQANPAQLGDHFHRVEQRIIGLEDTGDIVGRVQVGLEVSAFHVLAINAEPLIVALHRAQAIDLPRLAGDVEFALALERHVHGVLLKILLESIEVFPTQAHQLLCLPRPALQRIGHAMGNARCAEPAVASARLTAALPGLQHHDHCIGPTLARFQCRPQADKTTTDDGDVA
ncbi:hypothetical protein D3C73_706330 [compost metagenome]